MDKKYTKRATDKNINDLHDKVDKLIKALFGDIDNIDKIGLAPRVFENEKVLKEHLESHEKTKTIMFKWFFGGSFITCIFSIFAKYIEDFRGCFK